MTPAQVITLRINLRDQFIEWKRTQQDAIDLLVEKLITADNTDATRIKFYQNAILAKRHDIAMRESHLAQVLDLVVIP